MTPTRIWAQPTIAWSQIKSWSHYHVTNLHFLTIVNPNCQYLNPFILCDVFWTIYSSHATHISGSDVRIIWQQYMHGSCKSNPQHFMCYYGSDYIGRENIHGHKLDWLLTFTIKYAIFLLLWSKLLKEFHHIFISAII